MLRVDFMEVNSETGLKLMLAVYVLIVCDGAGVYCILVWMSFLSYCLPL